MKVKYKKGLSVGDKVYTPYGEAKIIKTGTVMLKVEVIKTVTTYWLLYEEVREV